MTVVKTFGTFPPDQGLLLPRSPDEWLPADHPARFVAELVDEVLGQSAVFADYDVASRRLMSGNGPAYRSNCRFRRRHLTAWEDLSTRR